MTNLNQNLCVTCNEDAYDDFKRTGKPHTCNNYLDALEQAAIERDIRRQELAEQMHELSRHKGHWCIFDTPDNRTFCQEPAWCEGCEVFLRAKGDTGG